MSPGQRAINASWSLRWSLLASLGAVLLIALLVIGLGVSDFVAVAEQFAWRGLQGEAAQRAASTVAAHMERAEDTVAVLGLLDRQYVTARPEIAEDLLLAKPDLLELIRVDERGAIVASVFRDAPVLANQFTIPQAQWFHEAATGRTFVSSVQISPDAVPYVVMAVPAPDGGAVAARLDMQLLWDIVADIKLRENGSAYVVDRQGRIVGHTDPQVVLGNTRLDGWGDLAALATPQGYSWRGEYTNFEGRRVVGAMTTVPGMDWLVVTEVPRTEALALRRTALMQLVAGLSLFWLLVMGLTNWLLARLIFQPVERLQAGAECIGGGDLHQRIGVIRRDEIGQVTEAFNEMAERLGEREEQLAARSAALAAEVSVRKQAEEAITQYSGRLEDLVAERTRELVETQDQLVRQEKLAVLGQMAGGIAHELRGPLAVINNAAFLLNEHLGDPRPEVREVLDTLEEEVRASTAIINSLLSFARLAPPARQDVNVADLVREALLRTPIPEGIEVVTQIAGRLPSIQADPDQLRQAFGNLLNNAVQAMPDGGELAVAAETSGPAGVVVSFADTGQGIAEEDLDRIFEPLFTTKSKGIGLGLALVKSLVEGHGGTVSVTSEVGRGSTFTVRLPANESRSADRRG